MKKDTSDYFLGLTKAKGICLVVCRLRRASISKVIESLYLDVTRGNGRYKIVDARPGFLSSRFKLLLSLIMHR